ncbi:pectin lyase fold/virulence factor [Amylocarpus encephaloides]|uniref:pectinesterase n=1 Tax=Amylocarpus encephaloides TaxID=45428 RepID=A0A9P8C090_9HELO|nr:pectin lyase fold/virulence factor [Amylocarpus encephaloides]
MKLLGLFTCFCTLAVARAVVLEVKAGRETGRIEAAAFTTINDALKAANPGDTIVLFPGVFKERLLVSKDSITLRGSTSSTKPSENEVSIEAAKYASDTISDDDSATLLVTGSNFRAYNLNITNSAAGAEKASVAISSTGTNNAFYVCGIHGTQGVFYAHLGSVFVARSYIQGGTDVAYGRTANAWFQGVRLGATKEGGTLSAQGRQKGGTGYFVFDKAKVVVGKGADAYTKGSVFLGRPWGDYARTVFQYSDLGDVVAGAGWRLYTSSQATKNILFGEYANSNDDGARVSWAKSLSSATSISSILPDYKNWVDSSFIGASSP